MQFLHPRYSTRNKIRHTLLRNTKQRTRGFLFCLFLITETFSSRELTLKFVKWAISRTIYIIRNRKYLINFFQITELWEDTLRFFFFFLPLSHLLWSVQHVFHHVVIKIRQLFLRPATCLMSTLLETGVGANDYKCNRDQRLNVYSKFWSPILWLTIENVA
jgi:hypothetical protein